MSEYAPTEITTKTGDRVIVRSTRPDDAAAIVEHLKGVITEADYLITLPDEFELTAEKKRVWIEKHLEEPNWLALVAEQQGEPGVIGFLSCDNYQRKRLSHIGKLQMSVDLGWRSRGVGAALLNALIDWASEHPHLEKLGLNVLASNEPAMGLYLKMGFREEGRRLREVKIGPNEYVDDVLMYRFV